MEAKRQRTSNLLLKFIESSKPKMHTPPANTSEENEQIIYSESLEIDDMFCLLGASVYFSERQSKGDMDEIPPEDLIQIAEVYAKHLKNKDSSKMQNEIIELKKLLSEVGLEQKAPYIMRLNI